MKKKIKILVCPFILLGFIFMLSNSCKKDQASLAIGDSYQGGIIAYILQFGDPYYIAGEQHGIIAAPSDQSTNIKWNNGSFIETGATATAIGSGRANTDTIISVQGAGNYAAKLCADLVLGGYSDWYLPSKEELNKLRDNRIAIGNFISDYYWSSTETSTDEAWEQSFYNGTKYAEFKNVGYYVRAIRSF